MSFESLCSSSFCVALCECFSATDDFCDKVSKGHMSRPFLWIMENSKREAWGVVNNITATVAASMAGMKIFSIV